MPASATSNRSPLACPFFMPTRKLEEGAWLHPSRLPLGAGWNGHCSAPGHEGEEPTATELAEGCNLGYAVSCFRMPGERACDAVRFSVARDLGFEISLCFVTEHAHLPVSNGLLTYDAGAQVWTRVHPDLRIQKMAECYLDSYLLRRMQNGATPTRAQAND